MPKKVRNMGISLFNREIHGKASLDNPDYWKKRLKIDFGVQVENDENIIPVHQLYQHYNDYFEFIKSAIEDLPSLRPRDIRDFLCDKNIGQGKLQIQLLKLMLTKPGAEQACAYQDWDGSSGLQVALYKDNNKAFELIKDKLSLEQRESFIPSIQKELTSKSGLKSQYSPKFDGSIESLAVRDDLALFESALVELGDTAKQFFLKERGLYNRNILHLLSKSGSIKCMQLLIDVLNQDIGELYYPDELDQTPAHCIRMYSTSTEFLKMVLRLSNFNLKEELFFNKDYMHFTLFNWVMISGNIKVISFITSLVGEPYSLVEEQYQSDSKVISTIQEIETAFPFYFLSKNIDFDSDSPFIQQYKDNKDDIFFTISLSIDNYLKSHESDLSTRIEI